MTAAYVPVSEINASAPPPDVALVLPTLYSGGAERVQLNLAAYFIGRGLRVRGRQRRQQEDGGKQ